MTEMNNHDLLAVRQYVTAESASQRLHDDTVLIDVTHSNLTQRHLEIRMNRHESVCALRSKIYQQTGTPDDFQCLQVLDSSNYVVANIPPGCTRKIGYYIPDATGYTVHCVDRNPHSISSGGALENTDLVQKFRMTEETYDQRPNTLRSWKKENEISSYAQHGAEHAAGVEFGSRSVAHCTPIGLRCEMQPGGRRGRVMWVGKLEKNGHYVGIELDEPVGKHDGLWKGTRYFQTGPLRAVFCRGQAVSVGDYPERDILDESDDEI